MYLSSKQQGVLSELVSAVTLKGRQYALYGTGNVAAEAVFFINHMKLPPPAAVIDHNDWKGADFWGIPFVHLNNVRQDSFDSVILATNRYHTEMRNHLESKGNAFRECIYDLEQDFFVQVPKMDCHHHIMESSFSRGMPYIDAVYHKIMKEYNVRRICIFPAGLRSAEDGICGNNVIIDVANAFPDIFIPFASFNLGHDKPDQIDRFAAAGVHGVKFILPAADYGSNEFYEVYKRIEHNKLIAIFHTGISVPLKKSPILNHKTCSLWQRAATLENVAADFPDMKIICAHFGSPWIDDVIYLIRCFPNVYSDFSASLYMGAFTPESFAERLRGVESNVLSSKILFGTDVPPEGYSQGLLPYQKVLKLLSLDLYAIKRIMNDNLANLLGGDQACI